ncbi:MAG: hypothetical protein ABSE73_16945 [Planctomycetota bacterium]
MPRRSWFRFYLSTAVVAMLTAGAWMGILWHGYDDATQTSGITGTENVDRVGRFYGWPLSFLLIEGWIEPRNKANYCCNRCTPIAYADYMSCPSAYTASERNASWYWPFALVDALVMLVVVAAVAVPFEWWMRRRGGRIAAANSGAAPQV